MVGLWTGARYSSPSVSLFGLWLSYADTPGPMKYHCWRENFAFEQSGIISRRKPAQWMLAATVNVGLATSCLGPLGPGLCFLPWIFQVLTRRCSIPWRTWGILSARLSPCWPALSLAWFQVFPAGTRQCCPWRPPPLPRCFHTDSALSAWGSDDALKMANLQESEKLFLFNLQTEIKQAEKLVEKAGLNYT